MAAAAMPESDSRQMSVMVSDSNPSTTRICGARQGRVIQRILRHANVSTTATYYIKTAADDVRNEMTTVANRIAEAKQIQSDTNGTLESNLAVEPSSVQ
jgi:hypothetical protein